MSAKYGLDVASAVFAAPRLMHPLAIACLVAASLTAAAGALHLFVFLRLRNAREHLAFSALSLSMVVYDLCCVGLYTSTSLAEGIRWQKLQLIAACFISIFLIRFVSLLTGDDRAWVVRALLLAFGVILLLVVTVDGPGVGLSTTTPSVKVIERNGRTIITYYESQLGAVHVAAGVLAFLAFLYLFFLVFRALRRRPRVGIGTLLVAQVVYFAAVANDGAVAGGRLASIYMSEYAYLANVLMMAVTLLNRFAAMHRTVIDLNRKLEQRIEKALGDIKILSGLLPICAHCKRIRESDGRWSKLESYLNAHSAAQLSHGICPECLEEHYPADDSPAGKST